MGGNRFSKSSNFITRSIKEGLEKEVRIEQISKLFAKSPTKINAFFTNPLVVYSLSKAYYKIKAYYEKV